MGNMQISNKQRAICNEQQAVAYYNLPFANCLLPIAKYHLQTKKLFFT
jgi:hypothetical protein